MLMPALNEEARIEASVFCSPRHPQVDEVIVIDDGSVDETGEPGSKGGAPRSFVSSGIWEGRGP